MKSLIVIYPPKTDTLSTTMSLINRVLLEISVHNIVYKIIFTKIYQLIGLKPSINSKEYLKKLY